MTKITLWRAFDFIQSWVNQRWGTLLLGTQTLVQYLNMAALTIYFFEWRQFPWMRVKESLTLPAATTLLLTTTQTLDNNIVSVQNVCDDTDSTTCSWNYKLVGSDCDMVAWDIYFQGEGMDLVFARPTVETDVEVTYFGYNLFTESSTIDENETILIPETFLPALYHFTLALIYPHYTQYGDNRESSAYQMWVNYMQNVVKANGTTLTSIRPTR